MIYGLLFYEFFMVGLFAIGGGAATIPFLFDLSAKYNWFSFEDLANMIAVSESTPGPIGVNMATFAGFETAGVLGALTATFGLVLPSIIIIILLIKIVDKFACYEALGQILKVVHPAVAALILNAAVQIGRVSLTNLMSIGVLLLLLVWMFCDKKNPVFFIALSAVLGYVCKL